jgi:hypothetical protein
MGLTAYDGRNRLKTDANATGIAAFFEMSFHN